MRISVAKDLTPLKAAAEREIVARADNERAKYVTPKKDGIYITKREEGLRWIEAGQPEDLAGYRWIANEVGSTAPTAWQLVQLWINLNDLWLTEIGPAIEGLEMAAKKKLREATTPAGIEAAVNMLPAA